MILANWPMLSWCNASASFLLGFPCSSCSFLHLPIFVWIFLGLHPVLLWFSLTEPWMDLCFIIGSELLWMKLTHRQEVFLLTMDERHAASPNFLSFHVNQYRTVLAHNPTWAGNWWISFEIEYFEVDVWGHYWGIYSCVGVEWTLSLYKTTWEKLINESVSTRFSYVLYINVS